VSRVSAALALVLIPFVAQAAPRTDAGGDPLPLGAIARYGTARLRHGTAVQSLAFSQDGKLLASTSDSDDTVRVWDAATGREVNRADVGERSCRVVWTPDGRRLVVFDCGEALALLWDPRGGNPEKIPWGHEPRSSADPLALSADGKLMAVGRSAGVVEVFTMATGEPAARLAVAGDTASAARLAFAANGRQLLVVCGGKPGVLRLWDLTRGKRVRTYSPPDGEEFRAAAFTPDGSKIVAASTNRLMVLDPDSEEELAGMPLGKEQQVLWARLGAGGKQFTAVTTDGHVLRWAMNAGQAPEAARAEVPEGRLRDVAIAPDGGRVAIGMEGGGIYVVDARTGKAVAGSADQQALSSPMFLPGATGQAVAVGADGSVHVWEARTGKRVRRLDPPAADPRVAVSPDGRLMAVGQADGGVIRVLDFATGVEKWRADVPPGSLHDLSFSRDGRRLVPVVNEEALTFWDAASGKRVGSLTIGEVSVQLLAWSPDGRLVATASHGDSTIHVWELATGRVRAKLTAGKKMSEFAFSPDGKSLAAAYEGATVVVFDLADEETVVRREVDGTGASLAWAPDGSFLIVGTMDGTVLVCGADGKVRHRLAAHEGAVFGVCVSSDGKTILSTGSDGTALLWNLATAPPAADRVPASAAGRWDDLGSADAARAYRALAALSKDPAAAVAGCRERIKPSAAPDTKAVAQSVHDLDDPKYDTRERATKALAGLGEMARPALEKRLAASPSAEAGERLRSLLAKLDGPLTDPGRLREVRAVELLEQVRTPAAIELLKEYASGDPAGRLTREARAALERLGK
jgi:WD40 repeat protein